MHIKTVTSIAVIVLIWLVLAAQTLAQSSSEPSIQQHVGEHVKKTGKGAVLAIHYWGAASSALASKLFSEVADNRYYMPLYMTAEGSVFLRQLRHLDLLLEQLPAFIYYNQHGQEISRLIKVSDPNSTGAD